jgi:hypothetical protein
MIRILEYKVVIQKNNVSKDKYYPTLISASTSDEYPFRVTSANIKIKTNSSKGTQGYVSPIEVDDHIRLQVSVTYTPTQKRAWVDIFQGTIQEIESVYGTSNVSNLHCVGYMDEVIYTELENAYTWVNQFDAWDVFAYFILTQGYRRRLTFESSYVQRGVVFTAYNTSVNQTFLSDVINDMEEYSGFKYRAFAIPVYDGNNNLSNVYFGWKPLSTVVTDRYKVIEGTSRYISSEFSSSIEGLINRFVAIGSSTLTSTSTYTGSTSIAKYGKRSRIETFNWVTASSQLDLIAENLVKDSEGAIVSGTATIIGTPYATVGDLVHCKSLSQEVNRTPIDTNMTVFRVNHEISESGTFTTKLDLGRIRKSAYDYIGMIATATKKCKKAIVKCR